MKIVRVPLGFDLDPTSISDCQFPELMREQLQVVVDQAKAAGATVDWATLCLLPEETRYGTLDGEEVQVIRHLHATVDGVQIVEEE